MRAQGGGLAQREGARHPPPRAGVDPRRCRNSLFTYRIGRFPVLGTFSRQGYSGVTESELFFPSRVYAGSNTAIGGHVL